MSLIENDCEIRAAAGTTDAVLCRPEAEGQWPGILYLTDVGGIRPSTREQIRRLAAEGYVVLMPSVRNCFKVGGDRTILPASDVENQQLTSLAHGVTPTFHTVPLLQQSPKMRIRGNCAPIE